MKIILYLKTHNKTGLKYLGKTTQDPFTYLGSGKHWQNHLKKHGNDITTKILLETHNPAEISKWGIYYSNLWNIVESKDFANLKLESGDGGDTSMCESYRKGIKMRDTSGNKNSMYGRSAIVEQNIRWYNNGKDNVYIPVGTEPKGYKPGRIIDYKKPHTKETKAKLAQHGTKSCVSPKGEIFKSRKEAAKAYKVSPSAIGGLIARGVSGWRWSS
jgi:hypothetical protein